MKSKNNFNQAKLFLALSLLCIIVIQSCKKELLLSPVKSEISIVDAKAWYNSQKVKLGKTSNGNTTNSNSERKKSFSLLWNLATENIAKNNRGVVAIPFKNDIKLNFGKYGFRKMLVYKNESGEVEGSVMEVIFDEKDVKERKYAELYEMNKFNGKVILYDLNGKLKTGFTYKMGKIDQVINIDLSRSINTKVKSSKGLSSTPNSNQSVTCWSEYIDPYEGVYWPGCDCSDEGYWVRYCTFSFDSIPWVIDFVKDENAPPQGGGTVPYTPSFPGFYGSLPDPCDVDPNSPVTVICNEDISALVAEINELNLLLGLNISQQEWLLAHPLLVPVIKNYFNSNGGATLDNAMFAQWVVGYLIENPSFDYNIFFGPTDFDGLNNPISYVNEEPLINNGIVIGEIPNNTPENQNKIIGNAPKRHGNNPEDLTFGTNGNTSGIYSTMIGKTNQELFTSMRSLLWYCSAYSPDLRNVASLMADRFENSTGGIFENSILTGKVKSSVQYQNFLKSFGNLLSLELTRTNGNINTVNIISTNSIRPIFNGLFNMVSGLQILINDTESHEIRLVNFSTYGGALWTADVEVTIYDNFGLDKPDALKYQSKNSGFAAWWLLQHTRGYKPFETKIIIRNRIEGSY